MATAEAFTFFSGTNLQADPIRRFSPQTILPSTPDQLFIDTTQVPIGYITLPYLDSKQAPLYNGKSVLIVLYQQLPGVMQPLEIRLWDQNGSPIPATGDTLVANGDTISVTAFWDENKAEGEWILTRIV